MLRDVTFPSMPRKKLNFSTTSAENYLIWKAPKNLVLDCGFEPQIIADLRPRIREFAGQGSAGASRGLPSPTPDSNYSISLEHQPDFLAQKSLVQETIEAAGHLCIFLPKFHCKLNFIEYFWGAVKCYLCEHCNYTHAGLQENLPKALASVDTSTIWKWGTE